MKNTIKGGKADNLTLKNISNKFNVSVDKIENQLKKGIKIEMEHTDDKEKASEIAMDHISEIPDYYDKLIKMEKKAEKELKENKSFSINLPYNDYKIKPIDESQRKLIQKLLREELEEGNLAKTIGTLGMAASTLTTPNFKNINKEPFNIEKTDRIGVVKNQDGSYTSIAKTDGPTKEFAKELAINKAKNQIAVKLNLNVVDFDFEIVDIKYTKNKGKFICTVQILVKLF